MSDHDQDILSELISQFHDRLALYGCTTRVGPFIGELLENDIMPIFNIERWAAGPNQLDKHSYHRLRKALQLATLFLTEDSTLGWFTHYTFGHRRKNASGHSYIIPTIYENTKEAREEVKTNICELGKVITFMLRPASHEHDDSYGVTYYSMRDLPFFHCFRRDDWPKTSNDQSHYHPVVVMHNDFFKYFSQKGLQFTDHDVWLRTQFLFATTLVHEVAHAYSIWLGKDRNEPLWSKDDREAELGVSWENETLGYICNPSFHEIYGCNMLMSMKTISYQHDQKQPGIVRKLIGQHPLHFNYMHPGHFQGLFQLDEYRGGNFYAGERLDPHRKWVIAIYALSLEWIALWFDKRQWEYRAQMFRQTQQYAPPPLGLTFVLVYQQNSGFVWVQYPLDPRIEEDRPWIEHAAELEQIRGGDKLPWIQ